MARFIQTKLIRQFLTISSRKRNYGTKVDEMIKSLTNICATDEEVGEMKTVHKEIVGYLINCRQIQQISGLAELYKRALNYNIKHYLTGYVILVMYKALVNKEDFTKENIKLLMVLAWCYNLFTGVVLITDDISDGATIRRNKLAWHKYDNVGLRAINHSFLLHTSLYLVASKYFGETNIYRTIMEIFRDAIFVSYIGQSMDDSIMKNVKPQLELYTPERYKIITYYKASYPQICSTYFLASCLTGKRTTEFDEIIKRGAYKVGSLLQSVNDVTGYFNNGTDETNSDIAEGKCTWLVVRALEKGTAAQKQIIEKYYGQAGAEAKMAITSLYEELEIRKDHKKYERESLDKYHEFIKRLPNEELRLKFSKLLLVGKSYNDYMNKYSDEKNGNATLLKLNW